MLNRNFYVCGAAKFVQRQDCWAEVIVGINYKSGDSRWGNVGFFCLLVC